MLMYRAVGRLLNLHSSTSLHKITLENRLLENDHTLNYERALQKLGLGPSN